MGTLAVKELVAGRTETVPDFFGLGAGNRTDFFPGFLQVSEFFGHGIPVGRFRKGFGPFAKGGFLLEIVFTENVFLFDKFLVLGKEGVFRCAETVPNRLDVVFGDQADGFPFFLQFLHNFVFVAPIGIVFGSESFHLLTDFFFGDEILLAFLFLLFQDGFALGHDFFKKGAELFAEFGQSGRRNRADASPQVGEVAKF